MASKQVIEALEALHQELNKLEPAIKHIETAQQVTETVKLIPQKHLELLSELKNEFEKEIKRLTTENESVKNSTQDLQKAVKGEIESIGQLRDVIKAFHDKVNQINFPERLDKIDATVAGIMAAIQSTQSRLDNIERNLTDKLKDLSERQKETQQALQITIEASAKKQQLLTYITWALILIATVVIILIK
jgi:chromosome segregation ATPase